MSDFQQELLAAVLDIKLNLGETSLRDMTKISLDKNQTQHACLQSIKILLEYEGFDKKSVASLIEELGSKIRIKKSPDGSFTPLTAHVVRQADVVSVDFNLFKSSYDVSIDASEDVTDDLPLSISKRLLDIAP